MEEAMSRDFEQEVQALYEACPETRGEALPDEVAVACVTEGKNLTEAYKEYAGKKAQAEKPARQTPVRGVTGGGSVGTQPEDGFLRGFNSAW